MDNWYETIRQEEYKHRELLREAARERLANGVLGNRQLVRIGWASVRRV